MWVVLTLTFRRLGLLSVLCLASACVGPSENGLPRLTSQAAEAGWKAAPAARVGLAPARLAGLARDIGALSFVRALLVTRNGCLIAEHYREGHVRGRPQPLLSLSKTVMSAIVGAAIRDGLIRDLDQPLGELLPPDLASLLDTERPPIRVRQLLTMSSGLASSEIDLHHLTWRDSADPARAVLTADRQFPAGERFHYGTGNAHLLGVAIAHRSGRSLADYARDALFAPAGITVSGWERDDSGRNFGGIGMSMTPRHLARFAQLYVQEGRLDGRQILPAGWVAESMTPRFSTEPRNLYGDYRYGYFWWLDDIAEHHILIGRGFSGQTIHAVPNLDLTIVTSSDWFAPDEVATYRFQTLRGIIRAYLTATLPTLDKAGDKGRCSI